MDLPFQIIKHETPKGEVKTVMPHFKYLLLPLFALLLAGCGTYTLKVKSGPLSQPLDVRSGNLRVVFSDRREDKTRIGEIRGGFGNKLGDAKIAGNLESSLGRCFEETLEKSGYKVSPEAKATLEGEIIQFEVRGGGFVRGANEKIRLRLRNKSGEILWEKAFAVRDRGMLNGISGYEESMNVALTRLLQDALDEFSSEFFYQQLRKANSE